MKVELDLKGLKCPLPILKAKKELSSLDKGDVLVLYTTDPTSLEDFKYFCNHTGHHLIKTNKLEDNVYEILIEHK